MCLTVFVCSDRLLPEIEWDNGNPSFHIRKVSKDDLKDYDGVLEQITKANIYKAGSYQGCGCGFYYDVPTENDRLDDEELQTMADEDNELRRQSVTALWRKYLAENISDEFPIDIYSYWAGTEEPLTHRIINLNNLKIEDGFRFGDREYIRLLA